MGSFRNADLTRVSCCSATWGGFGRWMEATLGSTVGGRHRTGRPSGEVATLPSRRSSRCVSRPPLRHWCSSSRRCRRWPPHAPSRSGRSNAASTAPAPSRSLACRTGTASGPARRAAWQRARRRPERPRHRLDRRSRGAGTCSHRPGDRRGPARRQARLREHHDRGQGHDRRPAVVVVRRAGTSRPAWPPP